MNIGFSFQVLLLLTISLSLFSQNKKYQQLQQQFDKFINDADLQNASVGFYAYDIAKKEVILEYNQNVSLIPASSQKILTTAAALEILGENHKFKTTIEYSGSLDSANGTLIGDLVIVGGGDPTLGSVIYEKKYPPEFLKSWVTKIKAAGIKKVTGKIIADDDIFDYQTPSTWIWGDIGNYYGAVAYGLSVYDDTYRLHFETGKSKGDSTRIVKCTPNIPELTFSNYVRTYDGSDDDSYIFGGPFSNERSIYGQLPKNQEGFIVKGSIPDPALLVATELKNILDTSGVLVEQGVSTVRLLKKNGSYVKLKTTKIFEHYSPALSDIVFWTNKYSVNLFAESMLKHIGLKKYSSGDLVSGTKALTEFWKSKGVDTKGIFLNDGSGLSRYNSVSAKQFSQAMEQMKKSKSFKSFYNSLPTAGLSGTIRKMFSNTNAEKNLRAKSGYMSRIRSYAGYVTTVSGRDLVFSVIVNNYTCSNQEVKEKIEMLLVKLADINE